MSEGHKQKKVDDAVAMTFPASDPTSHGSPTGTEPPNRPVDRRAPAITKEQIEQAQHGDGTNAKTGAEPLGETEPVDQPDRETLEVRQGTGPREMVSVLSVSLALAGLVGIVLLAYFTFR